MYVKDTPSDAPDVFLSYASEDREKAQLLADAFIKYGWRVWWDREMMAGQLVHSEIERKLDDAKCVVVLWSAHSVNKEWVLAEADEALKQSKVVPVVTDDSKIPLIFRKRVAVRLTSFSQLWNNPDFLKLHRAVARLAEVSNAPRVIAVPRPGLKQVDVFPYVGAITTFVNKSFGSLQLVPEPDGLRFVYIPIEDGKRRTAGNGALDLLLPLDAVGGLWATARAFLYGVESLDENVILSRPGFDDLLIKLYRDKPRGEDGRLTGSETCWLLIVSGPSESEKRRMKLGPRDLLGFELACLIVAQLAASNKTHHPRPYRPGSASEQLSESPGDADGRGQS